MRSFPWRDLVHTPRFLDLQLNGNQLRELPSELSVYAPNLWLLALQDNLLTELPERRLQVSPRCGFCFWGTIPWNHFRQMPFPISPV